VTIELLEPVVLEMRIAAGARVSNPVAVDAILAGGVRAIANPPKTPDRRRRADRQSTAASR
jgi:hypothetical protein